MLPSIWFSKRNFVWLKGGISTDYGMKSGQFSRNGILSMYSNVLFTRTEVQPDTDIQKYRPDLFCGAEYPYVLIRIKLICCRCNVVCVHTQLERDHSSSYLLTRGFNRGLHVLAIGARQRLDIAMRKVDPWPRTNKSPTHMRTRANLQLFLANHREAVIHHQLLN